MSARPLLELEHLSARWGATEVVRDLSLEVGEGEVVSLLGPNGAGKSTLLRMIAGFDRPASGTVRLAGVDLAGVPAHRRSIGLLFQDPTLFDQRTVLENIAYAPLLQRRSEAEARRLAEQLADVLSLRPLLGRFPPQLSGGEQQRVALARTLAARPRLVLLDEPFASLDVGIRASLHVEFRRALREFGAAAIHVTHDREEGMFLGDRLALIFDGRLEAVGAPREVFDAPGSVRAARFLGYNILGHEARPAGVLPQDLRARLDPTAEGDWTDRASGPTGRGYLTVLEDRRGRRAELRSEAALTVGDTVSLSWEKAVPLRPEPA